MDISLIWAMAENGVIGRDQGLPWQLPKDMKFFMTTTRGKPVIMGRRTFETLKAPLPDRTNIVMTRDPDYRRKGVTVVANFAEALKVARARCEADGIDEIMVAGGADVYRLGLAVATRLYVTHWSRFEAVRTESFPADERHSHPFSISVYRRLH